MRYLILSILAVMFVGMSACQDRYRYHCQDPKHWDDEDCKHPKCEATQTCTDYLVHKENPQ